MAGLKPGFLTGANCKIRFGNVTLAYATDISYAVSVTHEPVRVMGRYAVLSNEPVSYSVRGTVSIVRYTKVAQNPGLVTAGATSIEGPKTNGNGLGNWNPNAADPTENTSQTMNPAEILISKTVDIDVFQRTAANNATAQVNEKAFSIKDCRLTRRSGGLSKRGVLREEFEFVGLLFEDDKQVVAHSGETDLSF